MIVDEITRPINRIVKLWDVPARCACSTASVSTFPAGPGATVRTVLVSRSLHPPGCTMLASATRAMTP